MFQYDRNNAVTHAHPEDGAGSGFGLASIPGALWRRKWWPIALALVFTGVAIAYSMSLSDRYQAVAQVLVDPRELRVLSSDVSPSNLNSDSTTAYIESQARIISSPNLLRRVIDKEGLAKDPEYTGTYTSVLSRLFPARSEGDQTQRIVEKLNKDLWVRRGERTFIIDIAVSTSTPEKSSRLANAFASAFLEDQANSRAEASRRATSVLTSRLNELRDRLRQSEDKVENYRGQKNIVGASGKLITEEQLAAVNSQLAFARSRTADAKAKLDQLESVRGQAAERGALPEAVNSQTIGLLRQQLGEAQKRVANLGTSLGPMHPEFVGAQTALRDAQRGVADEISRIRSAARAELDRAMNNEKTLVAQVEGLKKDTLSTSRDTVGLRELERELEANRSIYQSVLQRARETGEQERVDTTNVRIITTAVPPIDRIGPPRRLIVTGAAAGGFALGLVLALLAEIVAAPRRRPRETGVDPIPVAQAQATAAATYRDDEFYRQQNERTETRAQSSANEDLMRLIRMMGQLEKAIDQHGMPR